MGLRECSQSRERQQIGGFHGLQMHQALHSRNISQNSRLMVKNMEKFHVML